MSTTILPHSVLFPKIAGMLREGKTVTVPLRGHSMRPYLEDNRDKALLAAVPDTLRIGDVILAETAPGRYALHRITHIDGDWITMCGDGNFTPEHVRRQHVIAIATAFYRKGCTRPERVDTPCYRAYWRTWVSLRPIRRWLLLAWRMWHYPKQTTKKIISKFT